MTISRGIHRGSVNATNSLRRIFMLKKAVASNLMLYETCVLTSSSFLTFAVRVLSFMGCVDLRKVYIAKRLFQRFCWMAEGRGEISFSHLLSVSNKPTFAAVRPLPSFLALA